MNEVSSDWDFLAPWLKLVADATEVGYGRIPLHTADPSRVEVPRWLLVDVRDYPIARAARDAMALELVLLAMRVDHRVWGRREFAEHNADMCFYRREDLYAAIELSIGAYDDIHARTLFEEALLFEPEIRTPDYKAAKQRIHELDVHNRLDGFQIPLMLSVDLEQDPADVRHAICLLERLRVSPYISVGGEDTSKPYVITEVRVVEGIGYNASEFVTSSEDWLASVGEVERLARFNLPFKSFDGVSSDLRLTKWMMGRAELKLGANATNEELRSGLHAACSFLGNHLVLLTLKTSWKVLPLDQSLDFIYLQHALKHVELPYDILGEEEDAFERMAETVVSKQSSSPRSFPLAKSFRLYDFLRTPSSALLVVELLQLLIPGLESLALVGFWEHVIIGDKALERILRLFPRLKTLDLSLARLSSLDPLINAYKNARCRIQSLRLWLYRTDAIPLLNALADQTWMQALKELSLGWNFVPRDRVRAAAIVMLEKDHTLEYCRIFRKPYTGPLALPTGPLSRFHQQHVKRLPPGCKRALLSVPQCAILHSDIVARIFELLDGEFVRLVFE